MFLAVCVAGVRLCFTSSAGFWHPEISAQWIYNYDSWCRRSNVCLGGVEPAECCNSGISAMAAMQITPLHQLKSTTLLKISKCSFPTNKNQKTHLPFWSIFGAEPSLLFESIQDLGSLDRALIFTSQPREFVDPASRSPQNKVPDQQVFQQTIYWKHL